MRLKIYLDVMPAKLLPKEDVPGPSKSYDTLRIKVRSDVGNVAPALPIFLPFIPKA
jgi:hypothetical protein